MAYFFAGGRNRADSPKFRAAASADAGEEKLQCSLG
jgi:hypothetical protein